MAALKTQDSELVELGGVWVARSVPGLYQRWVAANAYERACYRRVGGEWQGVTALEQAQAVERQARGLVALGIEPGDRVGILAETSPEWLVADQAILHAGAVTVGVYPTLLGPQVAYQLDHARVRVLFVSDPAQLTKVRAIRSEVPSLLKIVIFDPGLAGELVDAIPVGELEALGEDVEPAEVERRWRALGPDDLATLIYTSGTTGQPKGAELTHGNLTFTAEAASAAYPPGTDERTVVFLPLAHALQRWLCYAGLTRSGALYFSQSHHTIMDDIRSVEPSLQVSVPRIWEKVHARILERVASAPIHRQRLFHWALGVGKRTLPYRARQRPLPLRLRVPAAVARRVVWQPLRTRLFGSRLSCLSSGGAPIALALLEFFLALDILILEGWGLTETAAPATINRPGAFRLGSVGQPLQGVEVRVAEDGELLVRGPGVFRGYHLDPAATAEAFDAEGFFRTGDIGTIDADGFVRITDRKKNLLVLANGKNLAPQPLENHFKQIPLVADCVVVGDNRPYLTALFVVDLEEAAAWARARGTVLPGDLGEVVELSALRASLDEAVAERNRGLPRFEQLKRWTLLAEPWTVENGSLTPTLKTKRRVILARNRAAVEAMYANA
ncbi:MAG: long-chain fatty acid--CoA ligase [Planctomycetes bacterium]|nr:long-chain fatty acid--CoA ligase [Planctomycetota bacterium]